MKCSIASGSISSQKPAVKLHDSQAYRYMEMTRERISFAFDPRDMLQSQLPHGGLVADLPPGGGGDGGGGLATVQYSIVSTTLIVVQF